MDTAAFPQPGLRQRLHDRQAVLRDCLHDVLFDFERAQDLGLNTKAFALRMHEIQLELQNIRLLLDPRAL